MIAVYFALMSDHFGSNVSFFLGLLFPGMCEALNPKLMGFEHFCSMLAVCNAAAERLNMMRIHGLRLKVTPASITGLNGPYSA